MEEKAKKPFYKKWWVWLIILFVAVGVIGSIGEEESNNPEQKTIENITQPKEDINKADQAAQTKAEDEADTKAESVPREYASALKKAETYAANMDMSKAGIYDQLVSEYGENFPQEAAQYAIDNIQYNWKENALKKAQTYAKTMAMSDAAIYEQLISEYGEKFTPEEAQYAIDNLQ